MEFKDYYKILGVDSQATPKDIKSAYRALARKYHPDLHPGDPDAERHFAEINEAYEVLDDVEERKKFDEIANYVKQHGRPPQAPGPSPGGPEDFSEAEAASFFEQFFGRRQSRATPRQGADIHAEVQISVEEAVHGTRRSLGLQRGGPCPQCGGAGFIEHSVCPLCRGRGAVAVPQTLDVKIPAGVTTGSTIRLKGQGQSGGPGGPSGDLLLSIEIEPHPVYQVMGHDLHRDIEVSVFAAVLGGEVSLDGPHGALNLKIPAESQNGKTFRLKGQGLPRTGEKPPGDLYVKLSVRVPTGLSEEQKSRFRELRDSVEVNHATA